MHRRQQSLLQDDNHKQTNKYQINKNHVQNINQSFNSIHLNYQEKVLYQNAITFLSNYLVLDNKFPLTQVKNSVYLGTKIHKDAIYYGQVKNCIKDGWGIIKYLNENIYEGQWKNDNKHGYGVQKFYNSSFYKGSYQNGMPQGHGVFIWANGQRYEGFWHKGLREGSGTWIGIHGNSYKGQWKKGNPEGYGIYINQQGDIYEGQFKLSLKHGNGIEKFKNGDMYKGNYENGKPSGEGAYYWENGSYFNGHFVNGLRNGKGIWRREARKSDKYEGEYKNDQKWGYGQFFWASGNFYQGNYEADLRNGYGQMFWVDGSVYKGEWKNGIQHGKGQIFIPGQGLKRGRFQNNIITQVYFYNNIIQQEVKKKSNKKRLVSTSYDNVQILKNHLVLKTTRKKQRAKTLSSFKKQQFIRNKQQHIQTNISFHNEKSNNNIDINDSATRYKREGNQKIRSFLNSQDRFSIKKDSNDKTCLNLINKSKTSSSRVHSKQKRLLHSSFYLYKLNQRHNKQLKQKMQQKSSIIKFNNLVKQYHSQHTTLKH